MVTAATTTIITIRKLLLALVLEPILLVMVLIKVILVVKVEVIVRPDNDSDNDDGNGKDSESSSCTILVVPVSTLMKDDTHENSNGKAKRVVVQRSGGRKWEENEDKEQHGHLLKRGI